MTPSAPGNRHEPRRRVRIAAAIAIVAATVGARGQSSGSFVWTDQSGLSSATPLTVHFRAPATLNADTPVWFALHGEDRNAWDYRDYLADAPATRDALVIAPEFAESQWPGSRSYNLGNVAVSESDLTSRPEESWSFSKIEPLFDYVRQVLAPELGATSYSLYGHSAGAQFLHRFLLWKPEARVRVAVAANAGWYTIPTLDAPQSGGTYPYAWPYTLATAPDYEPATPSVDVVPAANLEAAFDKRLVILLGEQDTLISSSLRTTPEANAQGPHRLARGQFFYDAAAAEADRRGAAFSWGLEVVPGVGHSGELMAVRAAEWLRAGDAAPGDFDADGDVGPADYLAWRDAYGSPAVPGLWGDANADGRIDAADYTVWRDLSVAAASDSTATTPATVPEPLGPGLLAAAAAAFALDRRGYRRSPRRAGHCVQVLLPLLALVAGQASPAGADGLIPPGPGCLEFAADGGPPLTVWTYRPEPAPVDSPVVVVMHGRGRNGEDYRDQWIAPARRYGLTVLTPEFPFDQYPTGPGYQHGGLTDAQGKPLAKRLWGPTRVEALFNWLRAASEFGADGYYFYGHSAGGQFVHRAMLVGEMPRVLLALPANAGWYTLPDFDAPYPAGLAGVGIDGPALDRALARPAVLLLGAEDIDPNHESLPRNNAAALQGPHRLARGRTFHAALTRAARERGVPLRWTVLEVTGAAHNNEQMAPHAARLIAEHHASLLSPPSATPPAAFSQE